MSTTIPPNNNTGLYNTSSSTVPTVNGNLVANNATITGNLDVGGYISAVGNIGTSGYLFGNGSQLTGLPATYGNANVAAYLPTYTGNLVSLTGPVTTTANVTGSYILGNGSQLSGLPATYTNANVTTLLASFGSNTISTTGNITAGNFTGNGSRLTSLTGANVTGVVANATYATSAGSATTAVTAGTVTTAAQPDITSVGTLTSVSVSGNVQGGNIRTAGLISAAGNITGVLLQTSGAQGNIVGANYVSANYFVGDGSQLTNLPTSNVTLSGNLAGNLQGNGYGANAFAFVSATGNITGGNINTAGGVYVTGVVSATGNVRGGNINTAGAVSATGNVRGSYILGDGSQLTNLPAGNYSNANVVSLLATFGSNTVSTTGNITGGYILGDGSQLTNLPSGNYSNANVVSLLSAFGSNTVSTTGNVTAGYFLGDGSQLTNLPAGNYSNANVTALMAAFGSNAVSTTGNVTAGNVVLPSNARLTGVFYGAVTTRAFMQSSGNNLTSFGVIPSVGYSTTGTNTISAMTMYSTSDVANASQIGIRMLGNQVALVSDQRGTGAQLPFSVVMGNLSTTYTTPIYVDTAGNVGIGGNTSPTSNLAVAGNAYVSGNINTAGVVTATGNVYGNYIIGDGSQLTNLPAGNYSNANVNSLLAAWGSNSLSTTGNVTSTNAITTNILMTGSISNPVGDNIAIENITTGIISATGNITGAYIKGNISEATGGYGNSNVATFLNNFGSNSIITTGNIGNVASKVGTGFFNNVATDNISSPTGDFVTIENVSTTAISATGNIQGNYFLGNGSALTGISANAGGSNTQIQYNNGNAFAGNAAMTFDNTTGNVILSNIVLNQNQRNITTVGALDLSTLAANGLVSNGRITMGSGYGGSWNTNASQNSPGTITAPGVASRLFLAEMQNIPNNGVRVNPFAVTLWSNITANISNVSSRITAGRFDASIGEGASGNTFTLATIQPYFVGGMNINSYAGAGTNTTLAANIGNANMGNAGLSGQFVGVNINAGSNVSYATGMGVQIVPTNPNATSWGNATTCIAYTTAQGGGNPANANVSGTTTWVSYYTPGATTATNLFGSTSTMGNIARAAANYYAFRNDDDLAKSRLGALERFHYFNSNTTATTGTISIDKNSGQYQTLTLSGDTTVSGFTNFVTSTTKPNSTSQWSSDQVTLVVTQGATPYTVTMPTGNANIRYLNGNSTVSSTANSTVFINITSYPNFQTGNISYGVDISGPYT